jgi:hypothetical protein
VYESSYDRRFLEESDGGGGGGGFVMDDRNRWLAGADPPIADTADRRQRVAHFFCISMALVWFCLDAMLIAHKGFSYNVKRCSEAGNKRQHYFAMSMGLIRTSMIVGIATMSQYVTDPGVLALVGLIGIVMQVMLRVAGSFVFDEADFIDVPTCTNDINGPKSLVCKASLRLKGLVGKNLVENT